MAVFPEGNSGPEGGSVTAGTRVLLPAERIGHGRVGIVRFGHEPFLAIIHIFIYFLREAFLGVLVTGLARLAAALSARAWLQHGQRAKPGCGTAGLRWQ